MFSPLKPIKLSNTIGKHSDIQRKIFMVKSVKIKFDISIISAIQITFKIAVL